MADFPIFRGRVWLADGPTAPWAAARPHSAFEIAAWTSRTVPAPTRPGALRWLAIQSSCANASGASYYVFLGASFRPSGSPELRIEVGQGTDALHPDARLATLIADAALEVGSTALSAGVLTFAHALVHPVDHRDDRWRFAAKAVTRALGIDLEGYEPGAIAERISGWWLDGEVR